MQKDDNRSQKSDAILKRIKEQETGAEFHPKTIENPDDAVEIWGKKIGRILGLLFLIYLVYSLTSQYILT